MKTKSTARPSPWLASVMSGSVSQPAPPLEPQTYGDLKRLVEQSERGEWPSRVNPSMTHTQALEVLSKGLATHPDDLRLDSTRHGPLYAKNVQRECRDRKGPRQEPPA